MNLIRPTWGRAVLLVACLLGGCLPAKSPSTAPNPEGEVTLDFTQEKLPDSVESWIGFSVHEPWGRWVDGKPAVITLKAPLTGKVGIEFLGGGYGPNVGSPIGVSLGKASDTLVFPTDPFSNPAPVSLEFNLTEPSYKIEFKIPVMTSPGNGDERELGIGLIRMRIVQKP